MTDDPAVFVSNPRSIPIAGHQTVHMLQFRIFEGTEHHCSRMDEPPAGLHLV